MNYNFEGLSGEVITPNNPLYEEARQVWNRSIEDFPVAIVYCYDKYDVSNAVCFARGKNIGFRIRSGGHNYEGYSTGNAILVIDISRMNKVRVVENFNIVKIQGGVDNKKLYEFVSSRGYPFPGGACPSVRVAGYSLGGGWGYSSRYLGLGCDSIVQIEIVDYIGRLIIANEHCNSDLFWACKGAGDANFGVIVGMTFKLPPKIAKVTLIDFYYVNCTKDKLVNIFDTLQNMQKTLDRRITLRVGFYSAKDDDLGCYGRGVFYGDEEEALESIKPLTEIEGFKYTILYASFLEVIQKVGSSYPPSEKFKSTGRYVYRDYTIEEINNIIELIVTRPVDSIFTEIGFYGLGGAVRYKCNRNSAFYYRDARYILGIQTVWLDNKYKKENIDWLSVRFDYLYTLTEGSYVNFPYSELKDYEKEYYGANKDRLREVKRKYDPKNIFKYPQSIKLIPYGYKI